MCDSLLTHLQENEAPDMCLQIVAVEAADPFRLISFDLPDGTVLPFAEHDLVFISYEKLDLRGEGEGEEGKEVRSTAAQQFHALGIVQAARHASHS